MAIKRQTMRLAYFEFFGNKSTFAYDSMSRMTSVTTAEGKTTRYEYDKEDKLHLCGE